GKPNGLVVVAAGAEAAFFAPRAIRELPMVGPKTAATLASLGVHTIGDLAALPLGVLEARFGRHGAELHLRAHGIYEAPVLSGRGEAKSISRETTFGDDEPDGARLRGVLLGHAERIAADLQRERRAARTVTLKLRFPPFETLTRSATSPHPLHLAGELFESGAALFERAWAENARRPVRLVGLGATNLQERAQQLRLGETMQADELATALSGLRERFGDGVIGRAAEIGHRRGAPHRLPDSD
ncbi:MAG: DNA polymerase IV, partial [Tepidiformaceae bacterium]